MTEKRRVFRLFACCVPVRGARRSTLCDLQRKSFDLIPNALYDLLAEYTDHTLDEIRADYPPEQHAVLDEYFAFLERKEYGFWTDTPGDFPPMDLGWDAAEAVTNAVIDVDRNSRHDWKSLLDQLDALGCAALQVRWFDPVTLEEVERMLRWTEGGRLRSVDVLLPHDPSWGEDGLEAICRKYPRLLGVVVHSAPENRLDKVPPLGTPVFRRAEAVTSADHCGQVAPEWFAVSIAGFTEARSFNSCLNRKVSVDAAGEIRNCPSMPRSFGNAADTPLRAALDDPAFRAVWEVSKDQVEVCRDCEFRYVCTDCRAFVADPANPLSKPAKCAYDPYTARWGGEAPRFAAAASA